MAESYASDFRDDNFQHQVVAICIKNGKPIAFGINQKRYVKNYSYFKCSCHAEMDLLRKLGDKVNGSTFYLYRFNNTNNPSARDPKNGKPCILCQHILKNAGVAKVVYLNNEGKVCVLKNRDMLTVVGEPHHITSSFVDRHGSKHGGMFKVANYVQTN